MRLSNITAPPSASSPSRAHVLVPPHLTLKYTRFASDTRSTKTTVILPTTISSSLSSSPSRFFSSTIDIYLIADVLQSINNIVPREKGPEHRHNDTSGEPRGGGGGVISPPPRARFYTRGLDTTLRSISWGAMATEWRTSATTWLALVLEKNWKAMKKVEIIPEAVKVVFMYLYCSLCIMSLFFCECPWKLPWRFVALHETSCLVQWVDCHGTLVGVYGTFLGFSWHLTRLQSTLCAFFHLRAPSWVCMASFISDV